MTEPTEWTVTGSAHARVKGFFLEAELSRDGQWDVYAREDTPVSEIGSIAQFEFDDNGDFEWFDWCESARYYLDDALTEEDVREAARSLYRAAGPFSEVAWSFVQEHLEHVARSIGIEEEPNTENWWREFNEKLNQCLIIYRSSLVCGKCGTLFSIASEERDDGHFNHTLWCPQCHGEEPPGESVDPAEPMPIAALVDLLSLVLDPPLPSDRDLAALSEEAQVEISQWAWARHLEASDNDVEAGEMPEALRSLLHPRRKPEPCLDPDKMHGAGDGFPGSDY